MPVASLLKETFLHWQARNAPRMGAALSYYALFSLAPLSVILLSVAGLFFSETRVIENFSHVLSSAVGSTLGEYIVSFIPSSLFSSVHTSGIIFGGIVLVFSALGALSELNQDLDDLWCIPNREEEGSTYQKIKKTIVQKIASFSLIPIGTLLFMGAVIVGIVLHRVPGLSFLSNTLTFLLSIGLCMAVFRILPNVTLPWGEVFRGACVTSFLFLIGRILIGLYISLFAHVSIYGAASSLLLILMWIYYSAQIFFIGASYTFVYSKRKGYLSKRK